MCQSIIVTIIIKLNQSTSFVMIIPLNNSTIKRSLLFVKSIPSLPIALHLHLCVQAYELNDSFLVNVIQWISKQWFDKNCHNNSVVYLAVNYIMIPCCCCCNVVVVVWSVSLWIKIYYAKHHVVCFLSLEWVCFPCVCSVLVNWNRFFI